MQSKVLRSLLEQTWKSPVFGDSFSPDVSLNAANVVQQIDAIAKTFSQDISAALAVGMPHAAPQEIAHIVKQIAPKTVSFCPALAAGELHDNEKLSAFAVAIGLMYWGDQTMDRGDRAMPLAIQLFGGDDVSLPADHAQKARAQARALAGIAEKIAFFAKPEDVPFVLACFREQVLVNEVRVQELSQQYRAAANKEVFLNQHAKELASLITIDAGFPSVSSSLYALYRQQDPSLPPLSVVYAHSAMTELLQVCNVVVRILDELGDWKMDAGDHPEWGVFTINPFNQPNEAFVSELLRLGRIDQKLIDNFVHFHDSPQKRKHHIGHVTKVLTNHIKHYITSLPATPFNQYVALCKRVLEIGYVNRVGDMQLAYENKNTGV
ncbi:MAG TPA: hypothetical protein VFT87_00445 [Candidatus Saccharimonadales bacterium]|nr:hypothetical protein [Candidatus Saccharimonadales bacterium]